MHCGTAFWVFVVPEVYADFLQRENSEDEFEEDGGAGMADLRESGSIYSQSDVDQKQRERYARAIKREPRYVSDLHDPTFSQENTPIIVAAPPSPYPTDSTHPSHHPHCSDHTPQDISP